MKILVYSEPGMTEPGGVMVNLIPRVLSYSSPGGRVGEDPGNEVE